MVEFKDGRCRWTKDANESEDALIPSNHLTQPAPWESPTKQEARATSSTTGRFEHFPQSDSPSWENVTQQRLHSLTGLRRVQLRYTIIREKT